MLITNLGDGTTMDIPSPPADPAITDFVRFSDALTTGASLEFRPVEISRD